MEPSDIQQPLTEFLDWVKSLDIPKDKFRTFVNLFRFPSPNVEFIGRIYNELERVFDGRNPAVNFQFTESTLRDDWEWYRYEILDEPAIWRDKGYEYFKTAINSIVVVDLPSEQTTDKPEPYFYFVNVQCIKDFDADKGVFEWVMFEQPDNRLAVYDDEWYRIIQLNDSGEFQSIISESQHDLGYCPVSWFWKDAMNQKNKDIKKSPLTPQLSKLDWLLFFSIGKRHLDTYAAYPIYAAIEADCDFRNNETGDYCDGGFLRDDKNNYRVNNYGAVEPCPVCSTKRITGAGSFVEIPAPTSENPEINNPIQIVSVDRESLDYNVSEVERLTEDIFIGVVGVGGEMQQNEALNVTQIKANFEDKTSILNSLKGNWEAIMTFVDDTICRLRYGDRFITSSRSMGTEFYIASIDDLYEQYRKAKENGASDSQLDYISNMIIETENRNDPVELQRMLVLKQLEPYRHYTRSELMTLIDKNLVDPVMVQIKINFNSFVERFERENTNIMEFGTLMSFDSKIKTITKTFKQYANEQVITRTREPKGVDA